MSHLGLFDGVFFLRSDVPADTVGVPGPDPRGGGGRGARASHQFAAGALFNLFDCLSEMKVWHV